MKTPESDTEPTDQAMAYATAALMDCYNPAPLPVTAPDADRWAEESPEQGMTLRPLAACYNG